MMNGLDKIRLAIQEGSQQAELIVGYLCLCKTIKSRPEQVAALVSCADTVLADHPILGLKVIKLALQIDPEDPKAVSALRSALKRRGRWATEARLFELSRTQVSAAAASTPAPVFRTEDFRSETAESELFRPDVPEAFAPDSPEAFAPFAPEAITFASEKNSANQADEYTRMNEFLTRCGFDSSFMQYAKGMSSNNCGLVTFVGILQRLQLIKPQDMSLAESMLFKMLSESPDHTEALTMFHEMFSQKSTTDKGER